MSITELVSTIHLKDSITLTLNSQFLNHNFQIVKQCLLKIKDIQINMDKSKDNALALQKRINLLDVKVQKSIEEGHRNGKIIAQLNNNIGDQFMKKMYGIEEKTKNMYDFDQTVRKIEQTNKFLLVEAHNESNNKIQKQFQKIEKLKQDLDRYLLNSNFDKYKQQQQYQFDQKQKMINLVNENIQKLQQSITKMKDDAQKVNQQLKQNNAMIGEINFGDILDKIKKFKEETESKVNELQGKMKKKVSQAQILSFQKCIIEKLDKFLSDSQKNKAEKHQTKDALLFLQKKIFQIEEVIYPKNDEEKDAMFASKKWQCASCSKDLGKFQGKLGQFKPWSIFPCKQLDPEKSGGFGYLNYIDKMSYRRGYDMQQQNLQRLSKTFYDSKDKQSPSKKLTTRGSNIIANYGSQERGSSLKDAYFKDRDRIGTSTKIFRVTKKQPAKLIEEQIKDKNAATLS